MKAFKKIPKDVLFSPGGIILIVLAALIELIDLIPLPFFDQIIELPLEMVFCILLIGIAKVPISSLIFPFLIERIPGISDFLPTWFIRLFL